MKIVAIILIILIIHMNILFINEVKILFLLN